MLFKNLPRRKNIKRMKVADAGTDPEHVQFKCPHCGYDDGWAIWKGATLTDLKRGMPCPKCNGADVNGVINGR